MSINYGFCDLCINYANDDKKRLRELLLKVYSMGYETVAINRNVDESIFESEKKKKKKGAANEPNVCPLPEPLEIDDLTEEFRGKLNILSRITFSYSDPVRTHSLNQSAILKKYNIFAVLPKSKNAFQHACSQLNTDIITVNPTNIGWKFTRKLYMQAIERGVHFEIKYSEIIQSKTRKFAMNYCYLLHTFGKSKKVIISSGTDDVNLIRNPYDIIALAAVLGLNELKAKASILSQSQRAILKSQARIYGKSIFTIKVIENESCSEDEDEDEEGEEEEEEEDMEEDCEESVTKKIKL